MQLNKAQEQVLLEYLEDNTTDIYEDSLRVEAMGYMKQAIYDEMAKGMSFNEALANLNVVKIKRQITNYIITKKQNNELPELFIEVEPLNRQKVPFAKRFFRGIWATIVMIPWWIIGAVILAAAAIVAIAGIAMLFLPVYGAFAFAIYPVGSAFAIFFLCLGAVPILMFIFFWIFAVLWEGVLYWIKVSARTYNPQTTVPERIEHYSFIDFGKRMSKKAILICVTIFLAIFAGGLVGTAVPKDGVLGAVIRNEFVNEQDMTIDTQKEFSKIRPDTKFSDVKQITFNNIWSHRTLDWNDIFGEYTPEGTDDMGIKVKFTYNTKYKEEKITPSYQVVGNEGNLEFIINFKYPGIESMMNVYGYGWHIDYSTNLRGINFKENIIYR
ncbi:hypothetical protein [Mesoplasma lactucae]|uniref:Uncharacterized protein n=1 Tax=Mesoplasma lactucae ATCC 49193 TaxID=81460 RepID=A0A291IR79_9MOLU|nr:hypothetical protein [Mesoplasma lactucae]ATG97244.1 hypothetical protein CP520_00505 [Mesoplasma lactucae ATCC 49193]ATZ20311.1 hypothetical protein MLACT_v1c04900 [Mesoplasma lactucae ATCC 49193]MCL8216482.1 hypothetical protein [Mesoplasma lactucae ATCC 49193]